MRIVPGGHTGRMGVRGQERTSLSIPNISSWGARKVLVSISLALLTYLSPLSSPSVSKYSCPHTSCLSLYICL